MKKTASITEFLRDTAGFVIRGSNVGCEFSFAPDLPPVDIDEGQMSQVVNNLVINAQQAMPSGGVIRIRGEVVTIGADDSIDEALETMIKAGVRRLPVIDGHDLVGMVSQADIARNLPDDRVGDLVHAISSLTDNS